MKPFTINRNTWHYKLNEYFLQIDLMRNWEASHNNFCSYWRSTIFRLIVAFIVLCIVTVFSIALVIFIYNNPIEFFINFFSISLVICILFGFFTLYIYYTDRKKNEKIPDSLFMQKYRAYKSKICPMIDYED